MATLTTYLYRTRIEVVSAFEMQGNTMSMFYTPNLKVYSGIDNHIQILFKNRDQKKVNLSEKSAWFIMFDKDSGTVLLSKPITIENEEKGIGSLLLTEHDLGNLTERYYSYSFKIENGDGITQIGYSDDNYSADGVLQLVHGVYPEFADSIVERFLTGNVGSSINVPSIARNSPHLHSAQVFFDVGGFTGSLTIEGTLSPLVSNLNNDQYTVVKTIEYVDQVENELINWAGNFTAVRFIRSDTGISKILYRP